MEKKVTKVQVLNAIAELVAEDAQVQVGDVTVTGADIAAYVEKTIEQLNAKAAKAKEKASEKKAEGDALRDKVEALLTDEYQTIAEITAQVNDPEVTNARVTARLTALVKAGRAHKTQVKTDAGRKINAYAAGPDAE